jgi:hypothetical protein
MPFGYISDDLHSNRKVRLLLSLRGGREALGLWTAADSWCNDQLTDGHVPEYMVSQLGGWSLRSAELLVKAGLWKATDGGFCFHDWEDFNESREDVLRKRASDAKRKNKSRSAERNEKALLRTVSDADSQRTPDVTPAGLTSESSAPTPTPLRINPVVPRPVTKPEPARFMQHLQDAVRAEFMARKQGSQSAHRDAWRDACQRVQDALDQGHFADSLEACSALAQAAVGAALKPQGKLAFALQQEPFTAPPGASQAVEPGDIERNPDGSVKLQRVGHSW